MLLIARLCGFIDDDDDHKETKKEITRLSQPSLWNDKGVKIRTPIFTENKALTKKMEDLASLMRVGISIINNDQASYNKAFSIHQRLSDYKIIQTIAQSYHNWGSPTSFRKRNRPLFIYMGTAHDGQIFGAVLDEIGNCIGVYYEPDMSIENVGKLWNTILSLYDKNGAIQTVILFDNFYEKANDKDRLAEGASLREIWDKDLETFFQSEVTYEHFGFNNSIPNDGFTVIKSSMPSFACINIFDGKMKPNIFCQEKKEFVWSIDDDNLRLVRSKTCEVLKTYDIANKSSHFIARIIADIE